MLALKASWQVHAGRIPGTPIPEYTRTWHYTSDEYARDKADGNDIPGKEGEAFVPDSGRFNELKYDASVYAEFLQKGGLNWVNLAYVWY